ncbi:hypothetical protein B0A50_02461 [Salinomyces thailandicus]|uniref:C3H1-type domain-containing protein n=1 Tax=Salinomyces thailandicus TaxID=706561 RepID=A0A4U0U6C5_9PEZI|nr:hypothetical protein B0A50_02461 [Salinomyces thailandica]
MATFNPYQAVPNFAGRSTPQMLAQPNQPRPLYFLSRNTGVLVPLIPADEIPFNVRLQGVPRVMQFDQTIGMQHVGTAPYTGLTFKVEDDGPQRPITTCQPPSAGHFRSQSNSVNSPLKGYLAPDTLARQALATQSTPPPTSSNPTTTTTPRHISAHQSSNNWRNPAPPSTATPTARTTTTSDSNPTQSLIDAIISTTSGAAEAARLGYTPKPTATPPSGAQPDQDRKEFCTYWIRTGECDYMQQGCLYKHEMPDRAGLERIGFRTVPRWWLERGGGSARSGGMGVERPVVGSGGRRKDWLKSGLRGGSVSGSSEGSSSEEGNEEREGSSGSEGRVSELSSAGSTAAVEAKPSTPPLAKSSLSSNAANKTPAPARSTFPLPPSAATTAATSSPEPRKPTPTTDLDLIDLTLPLPANTTNTTTTSSLNPPSTKPPKPSTPSTTPASTATGAKVFVPKGESPIPHLAAYTAASARKRAGGTSSRRASKATAATSASAAPGGPGQTQLQTQTQVQKPARQEKRFEGLMASRHAVGDVADSASSAGTGGVGGVGGVNSGSSETGGAGGSGGGGSAGKARHGEGRSGRTGCRMRRPAGFAGGVVGKGGVGEGTIGLI